MKSLGIDIGGTSAKLAMMEDGRILWTAQSDRYDHPSVDALKNAICGAAKGRAADAEAVGLCLPGVYDARQRRITRSVNVPALAGLDLDELVAGALGHRAGAVSIVSDAVATAYDIFASRKLRGRLLVLAMGTGIGAAVLDDGAALMVEGNSPGHIGQLDVSLDDRPPVGPDGGAGSLEAYIGAAAIAAGGGGDVPAAVGGWRGDERPLAALARAIRSCHAIYRPEHVGLAGGIGIHLGHVLGPLRAMVETKLTNIARPGWTLFVGDSELHAAMGAARMAAG